jgi:hypothetical protein
MIHEITIENFGSIRDALTINFRVARNAPEMDRFRRSVSRQDVRLPTVAAFVGPNGCGKSAILRAVIATLNFLINSSEIAPGSPIQYFIPFLTKSHKGRAFSCREIFRWHDRCLERPGYERAATPTQSLSKVSSRCIRRCFQDWLVISGRRRPRLL